MGGFDSDANGNRYVPQLGNDPTVNDKAGTIGTGLLYSASIAPGGGAIVPYQTNSFVGWYYIGRGMAMCASLSWSLESILLGFASDNTMLELLLPQKCSRLYLGRFLSRRQPIP